MGNIRLLTQGNTFKTHHSIAATSVEARSRKNEEEEEEAPTTSEHASEAHSDAAWYFGQHAAAASEAV